MGRLAQENASSPRVKAFGQMMVTDHSKANDQLKSLAASKNITLPDSVSDEQKKHMDELRKKTGDDFDKAYIDMMVDDHKEDVDMFEKASNNLKDADLKSFAATTLPTLRTHLDSAQIIQENNRKMMNNSKRGSQK
jgi:putative membrane protein